MAHSHVCFLAWGLAGCEGRQLLSFGQRSLFIVLLGRGLVFFLGRELFGVQTHGLGGVGLHFEFSFGTGLPFDLQ